MPQNSTVEVELSLSFQLPQFSSNKFNGNVVRDTSPRAASMEYQTHWLNGPELKWNDIRLCTDVVTWTSNVALDVALSIEISLTYLCLKQKNHK